MRACRQVRLEQLHKDTNPSRLAQHTALLDQWKSTRDVYISQLVKTADQLLKLHTALNKDPSGAEPANHTLDGVTAAEQNASVIILDLTEDAVNIVRDTTANCSRNGGETASAGVSNQDTNEKNSDEQRLTKYRKVQLPLSVNMLE